MGRRALVRTIGGCSRKNTRLCALTCCVVTGYVMPLTYGASMSGILDLPSAQPVPRWRYRDTWRIRSDVRSNDL